MNMRKLYVGPWKSNDVLNHRKRPSFIVAYRMLLASTDRFWIAYSKENITYYSSGNVADGGYWNTLNEAMIKIDEWFTEQGYIMITQEKFDQLSLLV